MTTSHLNLKWTVADVDRLVRFARQGFTVEAMCRMFVNTRLESSPEEIQKILDDARAGVWEHRGVQ